MTANDWEDAKVEMDYTRQLGKAADALLAAALDVYDNDDVFTDDTTLEQRKSRRDRDRKLAEAIGAYKLARGIKS